jgi:hypothetical protein
MPGIKTTIYDGAILITNDQIDFRGAVVGALVNGAVATGDKTIVTDGTDSAGFSVGDKLINGMNGRAVGIVQTAVTNLITLEKGSLCNIEDNATIEIAPKFECVAIMPLGKTASNLNESSTELTVLVPTDRHWFGTVAPNGAAWATHDDMVTRFGTSDEGSNALSTSYCFPSGTLIEGRWKAVAVGSGESAIIYVKASPSQTF